MPGYINLPVTVDANELVATALAYLIDNIPGYVPREGHLDTRIVEAVGAMAATAATVASAVPATIFRYYGRTLVGLPPVDAASASTSSTWTVIDAQGYTIAAGTQVGFQVAGDVIIPFYVAEDVVIPAGNVATQPGEVTLIAIDPGLAANGIAAGPVQLIDSLAFVTNVVSTAVTAGGADAETDAAYLDRLADELALMTPRPILPNDFAVLARRDAGVYRALAIDGYNPATGTYNNERMVTLVLVDANGVTVGAATKAAVQADLEAEREVNFVVNVMDPTTTAVAVNFTITVLPGYDPATTLATAIDAVTSYLSPPNWAGGNESPPVWRSGETKVRYLEVATLLNNVAGVQFVTALTIGGAAADFNLPGIAPLPTPGVITGATA